MIQAYIFIKISGADPLQVLAAVQQLPEVQQAHILLGPIDCIAFIKCADHQALIETITTIRAIPGVANTDTRYVYA